MEIEALKLQMQETSSYFHKLENSMNKVNCFCTWHSSASFIVIWSRDTQTISSIFETCSIPKNALCRLAIPLNLFLYLFSWKRALLSSTEYLCRNNFKSTTVDLDIIKVITIFLYTYIYKHINHPVPPFTTNGRPSKDVFYVQNAN